MKPTANQAIQILEAIRQQLGPKYLAYWVLPNTILTLSGARAFCDGIFWDDDHKGLLKTWDREITESTDCIKKHTQVVWSSTGIREARPGEKYAGYDLILDVGLNHALQATNLIKDRIIDQLKQQNSIEDISETIITHLKSQKYSKENLNHIVFGILLGYPDKAITESVTTWEEDDPFAEPSINADIRGAAYYVCPQPVYSYPRHLVNDPSITSHEQAWSTILKEYYTSDFHKSLEKNQDFVSKMQELGNLK